jgi:hypothetical protein
MLNLYILWKFLRLISLPFEKWDAYANGVIDKNGDVIVDKNNRTAKQNESFTKLEVLVRNIKRIIEKIPGGKSMIGRYAAALYLLKETTVFEDDNLLTESVEILEFDEGEMKAYVEDIITTAGIAGLDGSVVPEKARKKYLKRNKEISDDSV